MRNLDNLLKDTLLTLYRDDPDIVYALERVNYDVVNRKFKITLFSLIDPERFEKVDDFLYSDKYREYQDAISLASLSITTDLAQLIEYASVKNIGKEN